MPGAPKRLRCEYLESPIGIDELRPRLSWWLDDERPAEIQTHYHILAARRPDLLEDDQGDLWDSGRTESSNTCHIVYGGRPLTSRQRVWWKVRAFDSDGIGGPWSRATYFEMGLLEREDWRARWIGAAADGRQTYAGAGTGAAPFVRVAAAGRSGAPLCDGAGGLRRSKSTAHARLMSNSRRAGPTSANASAIRRSTSPDLLQRGENAIGVLLGDGWYCGTLGLSDRQQYGDRPLLLAQLEIVLADGTPMRIVTDDLWKWHRSQILYSDIMVGESVDARQTFGAWSRAGYDAPGWSQVDVLPPLDIALDASASPPIRVVERLSPTSDPSRRVGAFGARRLIYDFGQNFVGRVRLKVRAPRGTLIEIRHAERLDERGEVYTDNLRKAAATDLYTCAGDPKGETFEPRFTFHGFQFVEISGRFGEAAIEDVTGMVLASALPEIGEFQCDHPLLNQLQSNIQWSQRANFFEMPTDCPQRDERLGWTGDAQVFVRTAAFNMDVAAFFSKWLVDLTDAQLPDGSRSAACARAAALDEHARRRRSRLGPMPSSFAHGPSIAVAATDAFWSVTTMR